jgi:hypothetical protein
VPARAIRTPQETIDGVRALDLGVRIGIYVGACDFTKGVVASQAPSILPLCFEEGQA